MIILHELKTVPHIIFMWDNSSLHGPLLCGTTVSSMTWKCPLWADFMQDTLVYLKTFGECWWCAVSTITKSWLQSQNSTFLDKIHRIRHLDILQVVNFHDSSTHEWTWINSNDCFLWISHTALSIYLPIEWFDVLNLQHMIKCCMQIHLVYIGTGGKLT